MSNTNTPVAANGREGRIDHKFARELIAFRIGEQEFCVDIMSVREIRGWTPATPIPHAPSYVNGVINLRGAEISVLAEQVSEITGRTLVLDPNLSGDVSVVSAEPLDEDGVWALFQSILQVRGFVAVQSGTAWQVVPEARARTCDEEYALAETSWNAVLDGLVTDAPGQTIRLDWVMNEDDHLTRFVRSEVARLNAEMVLPETLNISVIPCGEANAFYDPGLLEIQICTEFGEELANMAR